MNVHVDVDLMAATGRASEPACGAWRKLLEAMGETGKPADCAVLTSGSALAVPVGQGAMHADALLEAVVSRARRAETRLRDGDAEREEQSRGTAGYHVLCVDQGSTRVHRLLDEEQDLLAITAAYRFSIHLDTA